MDSRSIHTYWSVYLAPHSPFRYPHNLTTCREQKRKHESWNLKSSFEHGHDACHLRSKSCAIANTRDKQRTMTDEKQRPIGESSSEVESSRQKSAVELLRAGSLALRFYIV